MSYVKGLSLALALVLVSSGLSNAFAGPIERDKGNMSEVYRGTIITPNRNIKNKKSGAHEKTFTKGALEDGGGLVIGAGKNGRPIVKPVPPLSMSPAASQRAR